MATYPASLPHVSLRPVQAADYQLVQSLWQDPAVRACLGGPATEARVRCAFAAMLQPAPGTLYRVISLADAAGASQALGLISIDDYQAAGQKELSYQLLPAWWGRGIAAAAALAMVALARDGLGLTELYAETQSRNTRSVRMLERLGMAEIDRLERYGQLQSVFRLALDRAE
ncbi:MAG: hypothetical protein A2087_10970 [Spirochaetes bacterium GWD1_61_31]|nr:MAG: hypothetical protein A2Y37_06865 [Spirochaetes bacterium GWB1_60_80]OHD30795.1 MAG: hypothetical protein A2004_04390 [Spirochaetes bacterium GWC1_61_12]OHD36414.1 MAG: hypothetical protein A2087_10970 [Spirochaetes bacterium GWD1_61_31]OHD46295.1 MAG: hypothetical protein A2Y35_07140 [Spirochaetes bacterium GWE1_60_18]OHD60902.1 MAG: hypothetical protein A2Y32_11885 [Spirochaetes bacterium GWF1_60_12]HAP42840.1 hypothetical protein [Spirochaetaceae bacterium]